MEMLSSFVFCETTLKQIHDMPEELRLKFYEAVAGYGIYGVEPVFSGLEKTVWISMKDIIDMMKYKRKARQKAGRKGGEANRGKGGGGSGEPEGDGEEADPSREKSLEQSEAKKSCLSKTDFAQANGNGNEPPFSLSENLNPNSSDFSQRLERLRNEYNALKIGPPFKKTAVNLTPSESSDLLRIMRVYADEASIKAMKNYAKILNSPEEYDPGACVYRGFVSFMIRGVEKYCDEAGPFELFRKRTSGPSPPGGQVDDWSNFGEKG
jgi:hypothetical protein